MNARIVIDHDNQVLRVCSWCAPGNTVLREFPHLESLGYMLSHGICPACKQEVFGRLKLPTAPASVPAPVHVH